MKILIVDDDAKRAASVANYLVDNKCALAENVVSVTNTDAARRQLRFQYFDALLLDVVLPKRDQESPSRENSLDLLDQLYRRPGLKRPSTIIALTSHSTDLGDFRNAFGEFCTSVVEAKPSATTWKPQILLALNYSVGSQLSRVTTQRDVTILTVHGIRTFGAWQARLKQITLEHTDSVGFQTYRYGYFSALAFFLPFLREREVRRFFQHLNHVLKGEEQRELVIFSHSFGTYIVAHALRQLEKTTCRPQIRTLVLSGSVLPARFDWSFIRSFSGIRVINDCGTRDLILWLCDAFVPFLGKGGKTGFFGFNNENFLNRFFKGGHGLYFKGDDFMKRFWLPLIDSDQQALEVDERESSLVADEVIDKFVGAMSAIKEVAYVLIGAYLFARLWH